MALLARLTAVLGVDAAILFALLTRGWQALGGVVTLLLIAALFSAEVQGYYYTFGSLLALQSFLELGLSLVITNVASHEWAGLEIDASGRLAGTPAALSRLASLFRFVAAWYSALALLFVIGVGAAGQWFFSSQPQAVSDWHAPWWVAVTVAAAQLWTTPFVSLLEGCNQVLALNRFRFAQAVVEAGVAWTLIAAGAGLWLVAGVLAVRVTATGYFLFVRYRGFFGSLRGARISERIDWRREVWPMQWRLGIQGMLSYFMFSLFNPVMFYYHGARVAGRMGMTWQIVNLLQQMSVAWIQTKVPQFGMLIARREFAALDRLWLGASARSFGFITLGAVAIWLAVVLLGAVEAPFASRLLDPLPTALLLAAVVTMQISVYEAAYLRAHKKEPFLLTSLGFGALAGLLVWRIGAQYGPTGAAAAYLAVIVLFLVPTNTYLWARLRREWQLKEPAELTSQ
ncbi:MAG TPA: hypothetical protein VMK05_06645 [Burkholderiales bacterium]|nr:hypothetical protein [Burkholderiales bacterium]